MLDAISSETKANRNNARFETGIVESQSLNRNFKRVVQRGQKDSENRWEVGRSMGLTDGGHSAFRQADNVRITD